MAPCKAKLRAHRGIVHTNCSLLLHDFLSACTTFGRRCCFRSSVSVLPLAMRSRLNRRLPSGTIDFRYQLFPVCPFVFTPSFSSFLFFAAHRFWSVFRLLASIVLSPTSVGVSLFTDRLWSVFRYCASIPVRLIAGWRMYLIKLQIFCSF